MLQYNLRNSNLCTSTEIRQYSEQTKLNLLKLSNSSLAHSQGSFQWFVLMKIRKLFSRIHLLVPTEKTLENHLCTYFYIPC